MKIIMLTIKGVRRWCDTSFDGWEYDNDDTDDDNDDDGEDESAMTWQERDLEEAWY